MSKHRESSEYGKILNLYSTPSLHTYSWSLLIVGQLEIISVHTGEMREYEYVSVNVFSILYQGRVAEASHIIPVIITLSPSFVFSHSI